MVFCAEAIPNRRFGDRFATIAPHDDGDCFAKTARNDTGLNGYDRWRGRAWPTELQPDSYKTARECTDLLGMPEDRLVKNGGVARGIGEAWRGRANRRSGSGPCMAAGSAIGPISGVLLSVCGGW